MRPSQCFLNHIVFWISVLFSEYFVVQTLFILHTLLHKSCVRVKSNSCRVENIGCSREQMEVYI